MRTRDTLAWLGVALVFTDLTFFSGASNFLASPQSRILNQVLVVGAIAGGGVLALRTGMALRSPLLLPGAAWVAATAIATLTSERPAASMEALALLLICAPAYLVVRAILADTRLRPRIDWLVIASTTIFVVAYLLQALTQWVSWWSIAGPSIPPLRPGDVGLTVGTVNAVALYLELLVPIAVWLSWVRWRSRAFTVGLAVLAGSALLVTGSRGAWLGTAAGAIVPFILASRSGRTSLGGTVATRIRRLAVVAAVAAAAVVVVLLPVLAPRVLSGDAGRIELWSAAWSMFADSPIVGVGPGAWTGIRPLTPISDDNLAVVATSHSSVLQILAETGVIGALAAVWLAIAIGRAAWRAITKAPSFDERRMAVVASASLVAAAVHSMVDSQFHLPAIVLLTLHLVARLELAAPRPPVAADAEHPSRGGIATGGVLVALGAVLLVPIDIAMGRAAFGNLALDRGDPATAAIHFDAAVALHDLPAYRLGQAIARRSLGDDAGSADALDVMERLEPYTFVVVQRAALVDDPAHLWAWVDGAGPYDATASVNLAAQRFEVDRAAAIRDLASAMVQVPTLVYSPRPDGLFDDDTWTLAQDESIDRIGAIDRVTAAAVAILAGRSEEAAVQRAMIPAGPESQALDLLDEAVVDGTADLRAAHALLRSAPGSPWVHFVLWQLGFEAGSQPLLDAVKGVAVPASFNLPMPPMELVTDGRVDADYSVRLPRWPQASAGRNGPKRPYIEGFITIEPVFRPKP